MMNPPNTNGGYNNMNGNAHPFPLHIEAHSGSSVVVGCSGQTSIGSEGIANEMERELLEVFRSLDMRERIDVLRMIYSKKDKKRKKSPCKVCKMTR